jgi:methyl-accepting chemotaxis protein
MVKRFKNLGIRARMLISIVLAMIVSFSLLGFVILSASMSALNEVSNKRAEAMAEELVSTVSVSMERALADAEALAVCLEVNVTSGTTDRSLVERMIFKTASKSPAMVKGVFTLWDTDKFDHDDKNNANTGKSDSTGRLMVWYSYSSDGFKQKGYDVGSTTEYPGYFEEAKTTLANVISEPYFTEIEGEEILCCSVVCPVNIGGKFYGIVGYEISLSEFQARAEELLQTEDMDARIMSFNGTYASASDPGLVMQAGEIGEDTFAAMMAGETYSEKDSGVFTAYSPFILHGTSTPWSISVSVPIQSQSATAVLLKGLIVLVVAAVAITVIMWFLCGSIVKPIKKLVVSADSISQGNMDFTIDISTLDETGNLANAFRNVQESIRKMVTDVERTANDIVAGDLLNRSDISAYAGDYGKIMAGLNRIMDSISALVKSIKESAANVASASQQISNGSQDLAQGTTEQASAIEEISVTVTDVVSQARENSDAADKARKISEKHLTVAQAGSEKMNQLLTALEEINAASSNISNIIKTIEDIAFQTNILALNASVEAARAGVHGKGFAVVAEEVKNLATKSAAAAKETNDLINTSISKAKGGVNIGEDMKRLLTEMVDGINVAVKAVTQIAEASKHQVVTIEQLNSGLEQISKVVQNNTATAEESASSSEEMSAQAAMLSDMVENYKVQ